MKRNCKDCGTEVGAAHKRGCDVARCMATGMQRLQHGRCRCDPDVWTGSWPGDSECEEFGWFSRWTINVGWVPCSPDHPDATHDLNRLAKDARWDSTRKRWMQYVD